MVTEGERLKEAKFRTKHVEDATSLELMSKRDIYEILINKIKREIYKISSRSERLIRGRKDIKKGCNK